MNLQEKAVKARAALADEPADKYEDKIKNSGRDCSVLSIFLTCPSYTVVTPVYSTQRITALKTSNCEVW